MSTPPPPTTSATLRDVLRDGAAHILRLLRMRPAAVAVGVAGAVVFVAGILASSLVVGWITDTLITPVLDGDTRPGERLPAALGALLGVGLWKAAGITIRRGAAGWAQFGALADLRQRLVDHQLDRSVEWYGRQRVGDLLAVSDTHARQATFLLGPLPFSTGGVVLLVGAVVLVTAIDPVLGALVGVAMVAVVVADVLAAWSTFTAFEVEMARRSEVSRAAHESIDGAQTVRALGRAQHEVAAFAEVVARRREAEIVVGRRWSWFRAVIEALPPALSVPVVVVGAVRIGPDLTTGDVVTVAYLMSLLSFPLALIGFLLWDTAHSLSAWERVRGVLEAREALPAGTLAPAEAGPARVDATGVAFGYDGTGIVHDVELDVPAGQVVALVGPTGSGKSTLAALLARLWDPSDGSIRVGGRDLRSVSRPALPGQVVLVTQETFLFDDTARDNVLLGRDVDDGLLEAAARTAAADRVVADLDDGWATVVGERGVALSGGQRQRLALTRALVSRPRLLVLDDATSAVDPSVEAAILTGLRDAELPSTVVMVAHRPAAVALADQVVFLVEGRVAATGPHHRLLREVPAYADLLRAYERDAARREETNLAGGVGDGDGAGPSGPRSAR